MYVVVRNYYEKIRTVFQIIEVGYNVNFLLEKKIDKIKVFK